MKTGLANPDESPAFGFLREPRPLVSVATEGGVRFNVAVRRVCKDELLDGFEQCASSLSPCLLGNAVLKTLTSNSGEPLVPPWPPGPEALTLVTSEPFETTSSEYMLNLGESRLPPGLPEPGSLDPVASETLPRLLKGHSDARAAELTSS